MTASSDISGYKKLSHHKWIAPPRKKNKIRNRLTPLSKTSTALINVNLYLRSRRSELASALTLCSGGVGGGADWA